MKICIRGGHNAMAQGADNYVNEVAENRKIYPKAISYLRLFGHEVIDGTPEHGCSKNEDLEYGVVKSVQNNCDYFASIHLNSGKGDGGCEVLYKSEKGKIYAERICSKLSDLGFINRGPKYRDDLFEINNTVCVANIIEVFFTDVLQDINLYKSIGFDRIGRAIAEGIADQNFNNNPTTAADGNIKAIQNLCNRLNIRDFDGKILIIDGIIGPKTIFCITFLPTISINGKVNNEVFDCTKYIQNRLNQLGYKGKDGKILAVDGIFYTNTDHAVRDYQTNKKLLVDGIVGPKTWLSFGY